MESWESTFMLEITQLRGAINSDFCAVALIDVDGFTLKWKYVSGNENEKFSRMSVRPGKGLSGAVVKVGRALSLNVTEIILNRQLHEYPILLAENLRSAYAVPLQDGRKVTGVLLVGDRKKRVYHPEDKNTALLTAERISKLVAQITA